jgi:hypothetical protein
MFCYNIDSTEERRHDFSVSGTNRYVARTAYIVKFTAIISVIKIIQIYIGHKRPYRHKNRSLYLVKSQASNFINGARPRPANAEAPPSRTTAAAALKKDRTISGGQFGTVYVAAESWCNTAFVK